jgi:hypothetical protein
MKNISMRLFDILLSIAAIPLLPIGFQKWKSEDFHLDFSGDMALFEGNMGFCLMLLGIALICYAGFDFWVLRKPQKGKQVN